MNITLQYNISPLVGLRNQLNRNFLKQSLHWLDATIKTAGTLKAYIYETWENILFWTYVLEKLGNQFAQVSRAKLETLHLGYMSELR